MHTQTEIETIATSLRAGGIVALPTETIYGLCCDPRNKQALRKLFMLKQRDPGKHVLCITGQREQIDTLTIIPQILERVVAQF